MYSCLVPPGSTCLQQEPGESQGGLARDGRVFHRARKMRSKCLLYYIMLFEVDPERVRAAPALGHFMVARLHSFEAPSFQERFQCHIFNLGQT